MADQFETEFLYDRFVRNGVVTLAVAAMMSLVPVFLVLTLVMPRTKQHQRTQMLGYFICLLVSNLIQSIGTVMSLKWVQLEGVFYGGFCSAQGGIKQAGNVGNALWSLAISVHLFYLLFMRRSISTPRYIAILITGFFFIIFVVVIGPLSIQSPAKGPYFGISGDWCWITDGYPQAQAFLEYFFEYLSAGLSFILYTAILLRVRGNLTIVDRRPRLRFVSKEDTWKLALGRDYTDSSVFNAVKQMIWYPVAYSVLIVPIGLARLSEFAGAKVPSWATIVTDVIFNLTGLVNVLLFLTTHRLFPEIHSLPEYVTPRKQLSKSIYNRLGIEPFMSFGDPPMTGAPPSVLSNEKPLPPPPIHLGRPFSQATVIGPNTSLVPLRANYGI
ncbi:hypothetical protein C8J56DRAFT_916302 [Mycena floridula]|nr:hypothetical protein C8J56DRAFT_916302 [Mycena floridula]